MPAINHTRLPVFLELSGETGDTTANWRFRNRAFDDWGKTLLDKTN
jgi:hypothetical protein